MSKNKMILLSCGSFNPVTNMHLRLFELARDALHKTSVCDVIAGVMSPTHDAYKKKGLIESKHRLAMCQLGTQSSDWIRVSDWEANQDAWSTTITVLNYVQKNAPILSSLPASSFDNKVSVRLLCGADLMESFNVPGLWKDEDIECIVGQFGLVVITREGFDPARFIEGHPTLSKFKSNILVVTEPIPNEISATKIRQALSWKQSIKYLVPDPVIQYISKNNLYASD